MTTRGASGRRSFLRDFGVASLIAVPLALGAVYGWFNGETAAAGPRVQTVAAATDLASAQPPVVSPAAREPAFAASQPVVPYFEIRPTAGPKPAPEPPAAVAPPPRVSDAGWEARAVRPPRVRAGAWVALVIDDLGLDRVRAARVAALPGPLTMAFMSYAGEVGAQAAAARQAGHEILLHMPMEPEGREDPGPGAVLVGMAAADIRTRVAAALDRLPMAVGLNNHMGSRFTRDARAMRPVLDELAARGLLFVDSRTSGGSVAAGLAVDMGLAAAGRDVFLDNEIDGNAVRKQLAELERLATRRGMAIAIGHPHDATIEALAAWIPTMNSRGLQLVPVSAIVRGLRRDPAGREAIAMGASTAEPPPPVRVASSRASALAPVGAAPAETTAADPAPSGPGAAAAPVPQNPVPAPTFSGEQPWLRYPAR